MPTEELEKSLRVEIEKYLHERLSAVHEEISRVQKEVGDSFSRLLERSEPGTDGENANVAVAISEHVRAAHERGVELAAAESARTKASSDLALLKSAVEEIDEKRSQTDILNSLVKSATAFAPRLVFFVVKGEEVRGWRARGLEGTVGDDSIRDVVLPLSGDNMFSEVVNSKAIWSGSAGTHQQDYILLEKLGGDPPDRMVVIPLVVRNKTVAALYADSAGLGADAINIEALETLVLVTGLAVELLAATASTPGLRPPRERVRAPEPGPEEAKPAGEEAAPPGHEEKEPEEEKAETHVETKEEDHEPAAKETAEYAAAPTHEATPSRHESSVSIAEPAETGPPEEETLEETPEEPEFQGAPGTPFQSWDYVSEEEGPAALTAPSSAPSHEKAEREIPQDVSEDEKRLHNDARRFARLLVSEIKLYNEQKVTDARKDGNIYERLREDIDRSRQMYDKRVAPPVAARYDYFHEELVSSLANGDASLLGAGYPGASVQ